MNMIEKLRNGFRKEESADMEIKSADGRWSVKGIPASAKKAFNMARFVRLDDVAEEDREDGANGPMPVYVVSTDVTPEMAEFYLSRNAKNFRKLDDKRAGKIAVDMKNGKFTLNNDMMVVHPGHLNINAQHRLKAIVEAGVPAPMTIVYGMIYDKNIDSGRKREYRDYLRNNNVRHWWHIATAMPEIMRQIRHCTKPGLMFEEYSGLESYETVRAFFPDIADTIDEFLEIEKYNGVNLGYSSKVAGVYAVLKLVDPAMAMKALKMMYSHPEVAMETPDSVRKMLNKIKRIRDRFLSKKSNSNLERRVPTSALIHIFNNIVCGKAIPSDHAGNPAPIGIASALLENGIISKVHLDINPKLYDLQIAGKVSKEELPVCEELISLGLAEAIESFESVHKNLNTSHPESAIRRIAKKLIAEGIIETGRSNAGTHFYCNEEMAYGKSGFFKDVEFEVVGAVSAVSDEEDEEDAEEESVQRELF